MKIIQNVYLVKTLLSNCYLIEEGDELILIDAGAPSGYNQIAGSIRSIGRDPGELTGILLTHADIDHVWVNTLCVGGANPSMSGT